jgi:hypothetical protein
MQVIFVSKSNQMITLIVLSTVLLIIIGILFVPIRIVVNTAQKQYYLTLPGYLRADLLFGKGKPFKIKMRVFFVSFMLEPAKQFSNANDDNSRRKKVKTKNKIKRPLLLFINLLKSIKIKYCYANIDTGDFPLNAQLIPLVQQIQQQNINIGINFSNENNLNMMLQTRGIKIISVIIKHRMFNK